ncbi:MAG TPA: 3-deoxy-manno-octulosonate cytidylyltransferase [Chitinophagaceae bacterium]|nr:3-deoxy-manno-octulosonate cytidylyltransferase [Chitinophagaceae bacterium]
MKKIAMIPARLAATRFPNKLMQLLGDKTVIATVYQATKNTALFDEVIVVTDSDVIYNEIERIGGKAVMSKNEHESGTDRIAEIVRDTEVDIVVNVQGDTPFIRKEPLEKLLQQFEEDTVQVASIMQVLKEEDVANPNSVKVVVAKNGNALYFSRSIIPYPRNKEAAVTYYKHIGVYAFRKQALLNFTQWPLSVLEDVEKLEQLRYLENGVPIRMVLTDFASIEIDTPEDLQKAKAFMLNRN